MSFCALRLELKKYIMFKNIMPQKCALQKVPCHAKSPNVKKNFLSIQTTQLRKRHTASTQFFVLSSVLTSHCRTYGSKKTVIWNSNVPLKRIQHPGRHIWQKTPTRVRRHDTCPEASLSVCTGRRCLELAHQVSGHSSTTQIIVFANSGGPSQAVVPRFQRIAIRYPAS